MKDKTEITKAFRQARIVCEQLLSNGKITWDDYAFKMLGYEQALRELGVNL
jgi:hypothetical protein